MEKFALGQMGLRTGLGRALIPNVELTGLVAEFCSLHAYEVFTNSCFGVTPGIVSLGVCRNEASELAIDVEVTIFRRIVEEANVGFRGLRRCREGTVDQPDSQRQGPFHAIKSRAIRIVTHYKG